MYCLKKIKKRKEYCCFYTSMFLHTNDRSIEFILTGSLLVSSQSGKLVFLLLVWGNHFQLNSMRLTAQPWIDFLVSYLGWPAAGWWWQHGRSLPSSGCQAPAESDPQAQVQSHLLSPHLCFYLSLTWNTQICNQLQQVLYDRFYCVRHRCSCFISNPSFIVKNLK